jgi:hypothetical protein
VEQASTYEWGRDLRPAIQTIRQKYHYNHVHDTVSIAEMLSLFAGADAVRNLSQAPSKLPESALAVDLVAQLLGKHEVYSDDDTTEQASAASAESGTSRRPRQRKEKDGKRGRGRSSSRYRVEAGEGIAPAARVWSARTVKSTGSVPAILAFPLKNVF